MADGPIATAYVEIVGDFTKFAPGLGGKIKSALEPAAVESGRQADKVAKSFDKASRDAAASLETGGKKGGQELAQGVKKGADEAESHVGNLGGSLKKLAAVAVGGLAVAGIVSQLKDAAAGAQDSAKTAAITEQIVKTTGGAARISAEQVGDLATRLSNLTGIDDEVIQGADNVLLTFTNIKNVGPDKIFDQASEAALNLSTVLGGDVNGAAVQLGKALNDPVKGMTALSKSGVSFSAEQKAAVEQMVKTGDVLGAQKIILGEVNKEFGGTAAAAIDPMTRLSTIVGNLKESLGAGLLPAVTAIGSAIGDLAPVLGPLLGSLGEAIGGIITAIAPAIGVIGTALGPVIELISHVIADIGPVFTDLVVAAAPLLDLIGMLIGDLVPPLIEIVGVLIKALGPLIPVFVDVVGLISEQLSPILYQLAPIIGQIAGVFATVLGVALKVVGDVLVALLPVFSELIGAILPPLLEILHALEPVFPALASVIVSLAVSVGKLLEALLPILTPLLDLAVLLIDRIGVPVLLLLATALGKIAEAVAWLVTQLQPLLTWLGGVLTKFVAWVASLIDSPGKILTALGKVVDFFKSLPGRIGGAIAALGPVLLDAIKAAGRFVLDKGEEIFAAYIGFWTGLPGRIIGAIVTLGPMIFDAAKAALQFVVDKGEDLIAGFIGFYLGLPGRVVGALGDLGAKLWQWASAGFDFLVGAIPGMIDRVLGFFRSLPGRLIDAAAGLYDAGTQMIGRVIDGFLNIGSKALDFAKNVANALIGFINRQVIDKLRGIQISIGPVHSNPFSVLPELPTFLLGGIVQSDTLAAVHKGEVILNPARPADAARVAAEAGLSGLLESSESTLLLRRLVEIMGAGGGRPIEVHLPVGSGVVAAKKVANSIARAASG